MGSLLLIEPLFTGHHIRYVEWLINGCMDGGRSVVLVTDEKNKSNNRLERLIEACDSALEVIYVPLKSEYLEGKGLLGLIKREVYMFLWVRRVIDDVCREHVIEELFLPFMDYCLYAMAVLSKPFGGMLWSGIAMRPAFHFNRMGVNGPKSSVILWFKEHLFLRLLRSPSLKKIFIIDPCLAEYLRIKNMKKFLYVADPVQTCPPVSLYIARKELHLPPEGKIVLVYGAIDDRKGILEIIKSANDPLNSDVIVLLVGMQTFGIRQYLSEQDAQMLRKRGRLFEFDRYVSDEEEAMVFSACDYVWLGYRGHYGMSGVLIQAVAFNKPIIASNEGLISWFTRRYNLGIVFSTFEQVKLISDNKESALVTDKTFIDRHLANEVRKYVLLG